MWALGSANAAEIAWSAIALLGCGFRLWGWVTAVQDDRAVRRRPYPSALHRERARIPTQILRRGEVTGGAVLFFILYLGVRGLLTPDTAAQHESGYYGLLALVFLVEGLLVAAPIADRLARRRFNALGDRLRRPPPEAPHG